QIVKPTDNKKTKFILALLNSSLIAFYFRKKYNRIDKTFPEIRIYELRSLPIKIQNDSIDLYIAKVNLSIELNQKLISNQQTFNRMLLRKFNFENLSKKMENLLDLDFSKFIKELKKLKIV